MATVTRPRVKKAPEPKAASEQVAEKPIQLDYKGTEIYDYAFVPDGKRALSGSPDKTVLLWDVETGRCLRVLEGHTYTVFSVAWSADLPGLGSVGTRRRGASTGSPCSRLAPRAGSGPIH